MLPARSTSPPADRPVHGRALLIALSMAQFMVVLDFTIVNVALPSMQASLGLAASTIQWVVSAYAVAFGGFLLLGGRSADVFGRARLYRIGLVAFVAASISGGLAIDPFVLIGSRVVQGIGAAVLAPAGLSLLVVSWPGEQARSRALGVYGAVVSTGFAAGAVLGGLLVEATWRLVFFVNVPIGIVLLVSSWRLLPRDPPAGERHLDVAGAVLVTSGVALLVLAITQAGEALGVAQPALMAAAATLLLAAFVIRERTTRAPLVDLALFRDRGILGANLCAAALGAATGAELILLTLYLQESRGLSPALTGLCFVPQAVGAFSFSRAASKLVPSLGPRRGLAIAMAPSFVGMLGLVVAVSAGSLVLLLVATFVLGIANRLAQVGSTLIGTSGAVATRAEGTASALLTATRQCGAALGVAVSTAVLVIVDGTTAHRTTIALTVASVFALAGVASSFVTPRGRLTRVDAKPEDRFTHLCGGVA